MTVDPDREHAFVVTITWTGNRGTGTSGYREYARAHDIAVPGKPPIPASSDPAFQGDKLRYNPEEMLVGSLSSCHMLWYLHLCSVEGIAVQAYEDIAEGIMAERPDGGGAFTQVVLSPEITLGPGADVNRARALHAEAHRKCFIANSVSFPVLHEPVFHVG